MEKRYRADSIGQKSLRSSGRNADLRLLSLFCGPGGMDEGFRQAGFSTQLAIDIDQECVNTFRFNHADSIAERADITKLSVREIDEIAAERISPVGVIGGPPCQSFSCSNVHQRDDDPRNTLPNAYANLLTKLNKRSPISFFVFENVPGLLRKKHHLRYKQFKAAFESAGFNLYEALLDAQYFGVPQERNRIFVVGINRHIHPNTVWNPPEPEPRTVTVEDAIGELPDPVYNGKGLDPTTFPAHPNHWCPVPRSEKFKTGRMKPGEMMGRCFRTLAWDKPSWTVAYGHREVHVHPSGRRRLSMFEAMRLQTFPDTYQLTGNLSAQVRLVSEAVPVRMAWHIAYSIRRSLGI